MEVPVQGQRACFKPSPRAWQSLAKTLLCGASAILKRLLASKLLPSFPQAYAEPPLDCRHAGTYRAIEDPKDIYMPSSAVFLPSYACVSIFANTHGTSKTCALLGIL